MRSATRKISLWTGHRSRRDGLTVDLRAGIAPTGDAIGGQGRRSGAPDSLQAGLADLPKVWPATSPCDDAAVITFEPKILARIICTACVNGS